jgi:hypothetical protein
MKTFQFDSVEAIPVSTGQEEEGGSDTESICSEASDNSYASVSDDGDSSDGGERSPSSKGSSRGVSMSKLMSFMDAVPGAGPNRCVHESKSLGSRGPMTNRSLKGASVWTWVPSLPIKTKRA